MIISHSSRRSPDFLGETFVPLYRCVSYLSALPKVATNRAKLGNTPKTLPWTAKHCQMGGEADDFVTSCEPDSGWSTGRDAGNWRGSTSVATIAKIAVGQNLRGRVLS